MSTDPSQIRANIERTQDDLGGNVNALGDRMNPRAAARRQAGKVRGTWQRIRDNVMGSASHAREDMMGAGSQAREGAQHAREGVRHASEASRDRISAASASAGDRMHTMGQQARQQTEGHPLAAGLVAFGLGVLASSLLPASQPERRMAGQLRNKVAEHSDELKQQATGWPGRRRRISASRPNGLRSRSSPRPASMRAACVTRPAHRRRTSVARPRKPRARYDATDRTSTPRPSRSWNVMSAQP